MNKKIIRLIISGVCVLVTCLICLSLIDIVYASSAENSLEYIEINDAEGLAAIADDPYGNYILTSDISLKGIDWYPINFYGNFDGSGYTIYDLNSTQVNSETNITVDGNAKKYDTYFSGLFSQIIDASIKNLNMKACNIQINSDGKNCFAAGIAGYMENSEISNCSTQGYIYLYAKNVMCGVSGIAGFGYGSISDCETDITLVYVDGNAANVKCEQFLGGLLATGYSDIENCIVDIKGYASIHGFAHNGGLVGMYFVHTSDTGHEGYVRDSVVNGFISFFENNTNRRAYCSAYVGEKMNYLVSITGNTNSFTRDERFDYETILLPNTCENPEYKQTVTESTFTQMGYTTYQCKTCDYSFVEDYTFPVKSLENFTEKLTLFYNTEYTLEADIDEELKWSSSDESVVTVNEEGKIRANDCGKATITCALSDGTVIGECEVTVKFAIWQWGIIIAIFIAIISLVMILYLKIIKKKLFNRN